MTYKKLWKKTKKYTKKLFQVFVLGCALSGGYTYYHFYFAPTGLKVMETGRKLHRAELVDLLVKDAMIKGHK